jgi:Arc/MetJ-type ribon-helix-helix transcriptional regulator
MGQTHIQTRVPDTLVEEIEEYQEDGDYMNRSEALRTLLRRGLEDAEGDADEDESEANTTQILPVNRHAQLAGGTVVWIAVIALAVSTTNTAAITSAGAFVGAAAAVFITNS